MTTHSPTVLKNIPPDHVRMLVSDGGKSRLVSNPSRHAVASLLGGGTSFRTLLLTEDEAAQAFLRNILQFQDLDLSRQCVVSVAGDKQKIEATLSNLPCANEWMSVIGCFDGDVRENITGNQFNWPHVFLPGALDPAKLLHDSVDPNSLANDMELGYPEVLSALDMIRGLDPHDWLSHLPREVGRDSHEVLRALVKCWLAQNKKLTDDFLQELRSSIK